MARFTLRTLIPLVLMLATLAPPALADRIEFRDGRVIEGEVVTRDARVVMVKYSKDGKLIVERFPRASIRRIVTGPTAKSGDAKPGAAAKTVEKARRVVYLIDRSDSMGIDGRFGKVIARASAMIGNYDETTRLHILAFDRGVEALQRDYRNAVADNHESLRGTLRQVQLGQDGTTNYEEALRTAIRISADEVHIFTDGVPRAVAGQSHADLAKALIRMAGEGSCEIHVHLAQNGRLGYLGGEPLAKGRAMFQQIAKATKGSVEVVAGEKPAATGKIGAEISVVDGKGQTVTELAVGERYTIVVKVEGMKDENRIGEYLVGLPILARSVGADGSDVQRRKNVALTVRNGRLESGTELKLVAPRDNYRTQSGYVAAVSGGKIALFLPTAAGWVKTVVSVK